MSGADRSREGRRPAQSASSLPGRSSGRSSRRWPWLLYQLLMALVLLLAAPVLLVRRGSHYLPTLRHRLGLGKPPEPRPGKLWIHAVSVGEVGVAATLARGLPADEPALVTTVTPTGQGRARSAFGNRSAVTYLPFDLGPPVRKLLRHHRPGALVLVEGDYWPLVLREAQRRGMPVAVVNGRVGDRSFRRLRRLPGAALRPLFDRVHRFGVQTAEDRRRLLELGVDPGRVAVTGNLKYETPEPEPVAGLEEAVGALADGRPVLAAGSTMEGEEELVLDALRRLSAELEERAPLLVLAPRHPERWDRVADLVRGAGLSLARRSEQVAAASGRASGRPPEAPDVLLLDTLGELAALYRFAAAAFIGGTLVPTGGHNPLEAALWSVPVAVGPSMENFRQVAEEFDRADAWERVDGAESLADAWGRWLRDPGAARTVGGRGRALIDENRGALERTVVLLEPLLRPAVDGESR